MSIFKIFKRSLAPQKKTVSFINRDLTNILTFNSPDKYLQAYLYTTELQAVITKLSKMFNKATLKVINTRTGQEIENHPLILKFKNPNPFQSQSEFLAQTYIYFKVFGNSNILVLSDSVKKYDKIINMWNLPIQNCVYDYDESNIWLSEFQSDLIKSVKINGTYPVTFNSNKIIFFNDSNIKFDSGQYFFGNSKIESLKYNISNIWANYNTRNSFLNNRGAIGIFTGDASESSVLLTEDQEAKLQNELSKYGTLRDQYKYIFTNASLNWQQISANVNTLELEPQLVRDKIAICDAFGMPLPLMNELQFAANRANMGDFMKQVYNDTIIPDWYQFEETINKYFNFELLGQRFVMDFSHIEILQKDKKLEYDANQAMINNILTVKSALVANTITSQEADNILLMCGLDEFQINNLI